MAASPPVMADPATGRGSPADLTLLQEYRDAKSSGRSWSSLPPPPGSQAAAIMLRWAQEKRDGTLPPGYPIIDTGLMERTATAFEKWAEATEAKAIAVAAEKGDSARNASIMRKRAMDRRAEAVKRRAAADAFAAALRIQELEKELSTCKKTYDNLYEEHLEILSIHGLEIDHFVAVLREELTKATSTLLGVDTAKLFNITGEKYRLFLLAEDSEYFSTPIDEMDEEYLADLLETQEKTGEPLFFNEIMMHDITPAEYAAAKAIVSAPPAVQSSKKTKSENKWAVEYRLKGLSNKIQRYDLRERLRASPEVQAVIKKIIHDNSPKVISIFKLPSAIQKCETAIEECEAKAERYRKALHISVGISNAPAAALPTKAMNAPAAPLPTMAMDAPVTAMNAPAVPLPTTAMNSSGTLEKIYGKFFWVQNGNVYNYDQLSEKAGDFVGRLTPGGSINRTAAEVMKGGSRKTRGRKDHHGAKHRKTKSKTRS